MSRKRRPPPLSIRLPDEERAELEARAERAGLSVNGYFRTAILKAPRPRVRRRPAADRPLLAQLLVATGKIGSNVNQLAYHANIGEWPDRAAIEEACADIRWMRENLMLALGVNPAGPDSGQ